MSSLVMYGNWGTEREEHGDPDPVVFNRSKFRSKWILSGVNEKPFVCSLRECITLPWYSWPEDHRSPRDSWVESITISEPSSGERHEIRGIQIHISLLGAYHDGTIEFTYHRVQRYSLEGMRYVAGHGNRLEDELKLVDAAAIAVRLTCK